MSERAHSGKLELRKIEDRVLVKLNRYLYCHHCHRMTEMTPIGKKYLGEIVFECNECANRVDVLVFLSEVNRKPRMRPRR
jgi:transcription elongation factor Elf1